MKTTMFVAALWLALAASSAQAQARQTLSDQECLQIFPRADACQAGNRLNGKMYWEAWNTGYNDDADKLLGYIFLAPFTGEGSELELVVGVTTQGTISKVKLRGVAGVSEEFFAQFEGKSLRFEFEIAKTLEDLLFVPAKIKAQAGKHQLCEIIVMELRALSGLAMKSPSLSFAK